MYVHTHIRIYVRMYIHTYVPTYIPYSSKFSWKYFCDFHELHRNHENFCHKNFLTAPLSAGLDTLKSIKLAKITKILDHGNLSYMVSIYTLFIIII